MASSQEVTEQLRGLIKDIHLLEEISDKTSQFNIFEAAGLSSHEIRHSHFLSFILNPAGSHAFGDAFIKRFLIEVALETEERLPKNLSITDIVCANWEAADVYREYQNIDILIENKEDKIVVIIENKVFSGEHSDQLTRYYDWCNKKYGLEYRKLFIFLTPFGTQASHPAFLTASYAKQVCQLLDGIKESYKNRISEDVLISIQHYLDLVRRRVLSEGDLKEKAQKLYKRYQSAFDFIYENIPNNEDEICILMKKYVSEYNSVLKLVNGRKLLHCFPTAWENIPALNTGTGWLPSPMLLNIEVDYRKDDVSVTLYLGGGPEEYRNKICDNLNNSKILKFVGRSEQQYKRLYHRKILKSETIQEGDINKIEEEYKKNWENFMQEDFKVLVEEIKHKFDV